MITLRRSSERGRTKLNRLDSRHTFSFGDYYDPQHMAFRQLRVINEDRGVSFDDPWDPHWKPLGRNPLGQLLVVGPTTNSVANRLPALWRAVAWTRQAGLRGKKAALLRMFGFCVVLGYFLWGDTIFPTPHGGRFG